MTHVDVRDVDVGPVRLVAYTNPETSERKYLLWLVVCGMCKFVKFTRRV